MSRPPVRRPAAGKASGGSDAAIKLFDGLFSVVETIAAAAGRSNERLDDIERRLAALDGQDAKGSTRR